MINCFCSIGFVHSTTNVACTQGFIPNVCLAVLAV